MRFFALCAVALAVPLSAQANLWENPKQRASAPYLQRATLILRRLRGQSSYAYHRQFPQLIALYERAIVADPTDAEPHYLLAEIIYEASIANVSHPRMQVAKRAMKHWDLFLKHADANADPRRHTVRFARAITNTKLSGRNNLKAAIADYNLLIASAGTGANSDFATWLANKAETHMLLGELPDAVSAYERALQRRSSSAHAIGLAVALDRNGQHSRAFEVLRKHLPNGVANFQKELMNKQIFFVPESEAHYYLGLAHAALGNQVAAKQHFSDFLRKPHLTQYSAAARWHLKRLK